MICSAIHNHGDSHGHHGHTHGSVSYHNRAFAIGIALNVMFVVVEAGYGIASSSLALLADAGHNFSDVLGLLLAWGAGLLASKAPTRSRTYGYRKATILAALASALLLLVALGGMALEGVKRFFSPEPVEGLTIIVVAAIGVVINTVTALLFVSGQKHDLNIRGAFLHMAADAGVSLGVVISGAVIMATGWYLIDPVVSLVIVAVIMVGTWGLLRDSTNLAMDSVPRNIDMKTLINYLENLDYVSAIHDLHVWPLSTTEVALTVHLVIHGDDPPDGFLPDLQGELANRFGIGHSTIQVETLAGGTCLLDKRHCC